jgi:hypothetical protein
MRERDLVGEKSTQINDNVKRTERKTKGLFLNNDYII